MQVSLRTLLIDDNPNDRILVMRELNHEFPSAQVTQITDAQGFTRALETGPFELVITDFQLHWSDGLAILRAVKKRWPDCPAIMFTATGTEDVAVEAMKNGLDDYIVKAPKHFVRLRAAAAKAVQRSQVRQSLRESEVRYRELILSASDIIFALSADCVILDLNPAFTKITGRPVGDWIGRRFLELVAPDDRLIARGAIERAMKGETPLSFELRLLNQAGGQIFTELTFSPRAQGDQVIGILGVARDISERKRVDTVLRASEAARRQAVEVQAVILNALPAHVALLDQQGIIVAVNDSWRRFATANALQREDSYVGQNYLDEWDAAIGDCSAEVREVASGLRDVLAGRRPGFVVEYACHSPDENRWFRLMATPLQKGRDQGAVVMHINITERKQAEQALEQSAIRMEALSRQLLHAQEDERRKISRELHDQIGQALTVLKINLQSSLGGGDHTARFTENIEIVDQALRQVRSMALDLRPSILDDLGLIAALEWFVRRHAERTGLEGQFCADRDEIRAHPEIETACFRLVQEALTNVARHARATRFKVELVRHSSGLELVVCDDGTGFDTDKAFRAASAGASLGLAGMRERVLLVGGHITFVSAPTRGTEIRAEFPDIPVMARAALTQMTS
jgi:two-component system sensor histidine kinase UhpB